MTKLKITEDTNIVCICEGATEIALMEILLDSNKLIFNRENLIGFDFFGNEFRDGRKFEKIKSNYLNMYGIEPVIILLIQDNATKYKEAKKHKKYIKKKIYVVTPPEIEMIHIHHFKLYDEYQAYIKRNRGKNRKVKPSDFLGEHFGQKQNKIKNTKELKKIYNANSLVEAITCYNSKMHKDKIGKNLTLLDLLE